MDITATLAPKSNQMNADDLIVGPRTITVTSVDVVIEAEQPVAIFFEGDNGRPWRPCKSMRRLLATAWGPDSSAYVGRGITIFRDPGAMWGKEKVGGIRLSHLSHIDGPLTIMLTTSRGKRSPYKVLPLLGWSAPAAPAPDVAADAEQACRAAGLTDVGIAALVDGISQGECSSLHDLPLQMLTRLVKAGVSPEMVARCNGAEPEPEPPADDPDDLPAAWSA